MARVSKCPKCGGKNLVVVVRLPWSTNGLVPRRKIFLRCEDCGYMVEIGGDE